MLTRRKSRALKTAQENAKHNAEQSPLLALPDELFSAIFAFLPISSLFAARRICRVFSEIATNHVIRWIRRGPALYLYVSVRHPRDHGALVWSGHDLWPTKLQKSETMDDFLVYSVPDQSLFRRHLFFQCRACFTVSAAMIVRAGLRVADLAPDGFTDQGDGEIDVQLCWGDSGVLFPKWGKHSEMIQTPLSFKPQNQQFTPWSTSLLDYTLDEPILAQSDVTSFPHLDDDDLVGFNDLAIAGAVIHPDEMWKVLPEGLDAWYRRWVEVNVEPSEAPRDPAKAKRARRMVQELEDWSDHDDLE